MHTRQATVGEGELLGACHTQVVLLKDLQESLYDVPLRLGVYDSLVCNVVSS